MREFLSINLLWILTLKVSYIHVVCTSFHTFFTLHRHVHISRQISLKNEIQTDLLSTTCFFTQRSLVKVRLRQGSVVWADYDLCRPPLDVHLGCLSCLSRSSAISGELPVQLQCLARPSPSVLGFPSDLSSCHYLLSSSASATLSFHTLLQIFQTYSDARAFAGDFLSARNAYILGSQRLVLLPASGLCSNITYLSPSCPQYERELPLFWPCVPIPALFFSLSAVPSSEVRRGYCFIVWKVQECAMFLSFSLCPPYLGQTLAHGLQQVHCSLRTALLAAGALTSSSCHKHPME